MKSFPLKDYIKETDIEPEQRIFPITYNAGEDDGQNGRQVGWNSFRTA
jgi:hypothetical protein